MLRSYRVWGEGCDLGWPMLSHGKYGLYGFFVDYLSFFLVKYQIWSYIWPNIWSNTKFSHIFDQIFRRIPNLGTYLVEYQIWSYIWSNIYLRKFGSVLNVYAKPNLLPDQIWYLTKFGTWPNSIQDQIWLSIKLMIELISYLTKFDT